MTTGYGNWNALEMLQICCGGAAAATLLLLRRKTTKQQIDYQVEQQLAGQS